MAIYRVPKASFQVCRKRLDNIFGLLYHIKMVCIFTHHFFYDKIGNKQQDEFQAYSEYIRVRRVF